MTGDHRRLNAGMDPNTALERSMSRGLGSLQREILATLNQDHEADFVSDDYHAVYDLLAVKRTLAARRQGRLCQLDCSPAFEASFSRAIRMLVTRGLLRREWRRNTSGQIDRYHTAFVSRQAISVKSKTKLTPIESACKRMRRAVLKAYERQPVPDAIMVVLHGLYVATTDIARR
jgi:hypothetical protein